MTGGGELDFFYAKPVNTHTGCTIRECRKHGLLFKTLRILFRWWNQSMARGKWSRLKRVVEENNYFIDRGYRSSSVLDLEKSNESDSRPEKFVLEPVKKPKSFIFRVRFHSLAFAEFHSESKISKALTGKIFRGWGVPSFSKPEYLELSVLIVKYSF